MAVDKNPRKNGGPLACSCGKWVPRSRNNDGSWRKKRRDTGIKRK